MAGLGKKREVRSVNAVWIDDDFPGLRYEITSGQDGKYNCIAWAAGSHDAWWSHQPGYYWLGARSPDAQSLVELFRILGYEECAGHELEPGYEKVALYARDGDWTHAARQVESGRWTSKLGMYEDIEHATPQVLCGDMYGDVHCIMRRVRDG